MLVSSLALAEELPSIGFYPLSDARVPEKVREAKDSVFHVYTLNPKSNFVLRIKELVQKGKDLDEWAKKYAEKYPDAGRLEQLIKHQIGICLREDLEKCPLHHRLGRGSGFLLEEGNFLWTNYHVISAYVDKVAQNKNLSHNDLFQSLSRYNLHIYAFDQKGELRFVGGFPGQTAQVEVMPFDSGHTTRHGELGDSADFVGIRLSEVIGEPLRLADRPPNVGERVYALGFPTGTGEHRTKKGDDVDLELEDRGEYPDSPGNQLRVSSGRYLSLYDGYSRVLTYQKRDSIDHETFTQILEGSSPLANESWVPDFFQMGYTDVDVVYGNSGGPLLNRSGEVFGMSKSISPILDESGNYKNTSTFVDLIKVSDHLKNLVVIETPELGPDHQQTKSEKESAPSFFAPRNQ